MYEAEKECDGGERSIRVNLRFKPLRDGRFSLFARGRECITVGCLLPQYNHCEAEPLIVHSHAQHGNERA